MRASLARARGRCVDFTSYGGTTKPIYAPQACSGRTSIACSPVLRTPRAGGTPWLAMKRAAASMLLVRYSTWKGPGPRRASASAAGPGSTGCATVRPVGPRSNTAMSALMTAPRWVFGTGRPPTLPQAPPPPPTPRPPLSPPPCPPPPPRAAPPGPGRGAPGPWRAPLGQWRAVPEEDPGPRVRRAGAGPPPSRRRARGRAAAALGGVADLDPAPAHRRHVGRQVVALH